jgi:prepilin-type N-terminal cleavage/methylation domain-containing protein
MSSIKVRFLMMQSRAKPRPDNQGFTMIEVIVGILLTLVFTAIAMQAMVMAMAIKVHGDELSEATNWIQQDLENVKTLANSLDYDGAKYTISSTACSGGTASGYANRLQTTAISGSTIGASTTTTQYSSLGQRPYSLVRTTNVVSANTLGISYNVYPGATTVNPIASFYTEMVPGAVFSCRK